MTDQDELKAIWTEQATPPLKVDIGEIERNAKRFQRNSRYRNIAELTVGFFTVCILSYQAFSGQHFALDVTSHWISRIGRATLVLAILFVGYRWSRDFRVSELPDSIQDSTAYIEAYRAQLSRQAQLYRDMPTWYLAPFIPGFVLILLGRALLVPDKWPLLLGSVVVCTLLFVGAGVMIRKTAHNFEQRAQALRFPDQ